jgi:hypothetical protein
MLRVGNGARSSLEALKGSLREGRWWASICIFNFFGILLQGIGEKVWKRVFFLAARGIRLRVSGRDD